MGFLFGVANAIASSFQNSFFKKVSDVSVFVLNWFRFSIAIVVLGIIVSIERQWGLPHDLKFWLVLLLASLPAELTQSAYYVSAFQRSPQSLVGPLFSLSVLFLVPLSFLLNHELPSSIGFIGIISVVAGPFFLAWQDRAGGMVASLKNLFREPGSWRMCNASFR